MGSAGFSQEHRKSIHFTQPPFPVHRHSTWEVDDTLALFPAGAAQIYVFEEEEVSGIKPSDLLHKIAPHEQTPSHHPIGVTFLINRLIELQVLFETMRKKRS